MRRIIVLAIAVAGLVFAAQANALDEVEILAEKVTGTIEVHVTTIDGTDFIRVSIGSTWTTRQHVEALWDLIDEVAEPVG